MAIVWTDFREYRRGARPEDMSLPWDTALSAIVEGASFDLPHRSSLRLTASGVRSAILWSAPSQDIGYDNQESQSLVRMISAGADSGLPRPIVRGSGASTATSNGYMLFVPTSGNMRIQKLVNNVVTDLAPNVAKSFAIGTWVSMKLRSNATTLQAKAWAYGDAEPAGWDITLTDATFASGWAGFHTLQSGLVADVKYWCVATNGDTTAAFSAIDDPLDRWAMEPDEDVDISARFEYYDPALSSVNSVWISRFARRTKFNDYPSNVSMEGFLVDPGSLTTKVEADAHLGGLASTSRAPMRISNKPKKNNSLGPLASWENYSFYGRPVEIRIGRRWAAKPSGSSAGVRNDHRRYELIACGQATSEPDVGVPEVSLNWGPMVSLSDKLEVGRFIGISTGIKCLSAAGWLRIPSHASYDRTSFNIFFYLVLPTAGVAGAGLCTLSQRQTDATHRQWSISLGQASHATLANKIQVNVDTGAGAVLISVSSAAVNLGRPVPIILSVKSAELWYCYVDNVKVGGGAIASIPHSATTQIVEVLRNSAIGALVFDHRIDQYIPEETSRSRYSTRLEVDQFNVSMHRCDDATGNTVTDFNPTTANHGTLQGTDALDRIWYQTYMGTSDLAGVPMPVSAGVVYHGPTKPIDPLREIYRFSDGVRTAGTALSIKAQGATLTPVTNWTEPSDGPGTADIVGAVSQPVTFGIAPSGSPESSRIHLPQLIRDEMVARGHLSTANGDLDSFLALRTLLPFKGGFCFPDPPMLSDLLSRSLGSMLGFYGETRHGRLFTGAYLPPLNPGPYGQEPMLEFPGAPDRGVTFSSNSIFNLNDVLFSGTIPLFGLAAWVKFPRNTWSDGSASMGTYFPTGMTIIDRVLGASGYYLGIDGRNGAIVFGAPGVTGQTSGLHYLSYPYLFEADKTYFIICTQDSNTRAIFVASSTDPGTAVTFSTSELTNGAMTVPTGAPLLIGHGPRGSFYGYIGYVIGSSSGLSVPNFVSLTYNIRTARWLQAAVSAPSWTQTRFLINLTEGSGDTVSEYKSGLVGRVEGARWCPRMTIDLRKRAGVQGQPPRVTVPIWRAETRYRQNYQTIKGSDVAGSVSAAERIALGQSSLSEPSADTILHGNYKGSKDVPIDSMLYSSLDADVVSSMLAARVSPGKRFGDVANYDRGALRLNLSDEILLYANTSSFQTGRPLRIYSLFHALGLLKSSIGGWG